MYVFVGWRLDDSIAIPCWWSLACKKMRNEKRTKNEQSAEHDLRLVRILNRAATCNIRVGVFKNCLRIRNGQMCVLWSYEMVC